MSRKDLIQDATDLIAQYGLAAVLSVCASECETRSEASTGRISNEWIKCAQAIERVAVALSRGIE